MFEKYKFRKHSCSYFRLFQREKIKVKKILGSQALIKHVGSTAIKGLGGKGIVDIVIALPKKSLNSGRKKLIEAGYIFKYVSEVTERDFFFREYIYRRNARRVHLHLTFEKSIEYKRLVSFVKYMNSHPNDVKEYICIKKEAVKYAKGEGKKYRYYKDKFLKELFLKSLMES